MPGHGVDAGGIAYDCERGSCHGCHDSDARGRGPAGGARPGSLPLSVVNVTNVSKSFGARTVLDAVNIKIEPGRRLAVVGRNGEGKTTLLRILAGQLTPDSGRVALPAGQRVMLHDQRPPSHTDVTLGEYVAEGMADAEAAERELAELEARMAAGEDGPDVMDAYTRAHARLEAAGGYEWRTWLGRVTRGLGIPDERAGDALSTFSGGELTRASLARALAGRPDVLLLDEPTNHLDAGSAEWLEQAIVDMGVAVVVVSHDRWFLESVATDVLEIEGGRVKLWPMGYSAFRVEKAKALELQAAFAARVDAEMERLQRFVERWRAGTKAKQAASRQKQLDKMRRVEVHRSGKALEFGFPTPVRTGRVVLEVHGVDVAVAGTTLVRDVGVTIERGDRVALVGPNGAGKTTLLETLLGLRPPASGRVSLGHRVEPVYFSQHGLELRDDRTVAESVLAETGLTRTQARTLLGVFLFPGEAADRRVADLSGGERRRLSLALLVAGGGNFLVLDEPTNHLDAEGREALEDALLAYEGTLILISHDRALLDTVATRTLSIEDGALVARNGGWSDLVAARAVEAAGGAPATRAAARPPATEAQKRTAKAPKAAKKPRDAKKPKDAGTARRDAGGAPARKGSPSRELRRLETQVSKLEAQVAGLESEMLDPANLADPEVMADLGTRHRALQQDLTWALHEWETAAEAAGV